MKRPSFLQGVVVAFAASLVAAALFAALTIVIAPGLALRGLIALLAFGYLLYLLSRSPERTGRPTVVLLWCAATGIAWGAGLPLPLFLLAQVGLLWLVRSLYYYSSAVSALLDLALSGLAVSGAVWAATRSGSVFLATWCFFLVQALFVAIPAHLRKPARGLDAGPSDGEGFERAYRAADAALRRLSMDN